MTKITDSSCNNKHKHSNNREISFPCEEEIISLLKQHNYYDGFLSFSERNRRLFLDFCTGKSFKMLTYDKIFKHIFSPSRHKGRLESFLSAILGFDVEVLEVLEHEGERIADAGSLVILDIVVKVSGSVITNVEVQRQPYMFSGEWEHKCCNRTVTPLKNSHSEFWKRCCRAALCYATV